MSTPTNPRCYHCNAPAPEGITMAYGSHVELSCRVCALLKPEAFYATRVWPSPNGDAQCVVCNDTIHALASRRIEKNEATGVWENICLPCWAAKLPQLPAGTCTYCGNWTTESFMSTSGIRVWSHDACCKNVGSPRTGAWPSSEDRDAQAAEAVGNQLVSDEEVAVDEFATEQPYTATQLLKDRADYKGPDMVNHPPHYTHGGIECIDALEAALGFEGFQAYCRGAIIKYSWRVEHKGAAVQDLEKIAWYANRAAASRRKHEEESNENS